MNAIYASSWQFVQYPDRIAHPQFSQCLDIIISALKAAPPNVNKTSALMGGGWPPIVINGQTRKSAYVWPIKNPPERVIHSLVCRKGRLAFQRESKVRCWSLHGVPPQANMALPQATSQPVF